MIFYKSFLDYLPPSHPPWGPPPPSHWPHPHIPPNEPTPLFETPPIPPPPPPDNQFIESIDYNHQKLSEPHPLDPAFSGKPSPSKDPPFMPRPPEHGLEPCPPPYQGVQVFDYNHQPPPTSWDNMPHPPHPMPQGPRPFPFPPDRSFMPRPPPPIPQGPRPPHLPYFDLPAGLMIPLVPVSLDSNYEYCFNISGSFTRVLIVRSTHCMLFFLLLFLRLKDSLRQWMSSINHRLKRRQETSKEMNECICSTCTL